MIRKSFLDLAYVIGRPRPNIVRESLNRMATDPDEVVFWENGSPCAWDVYNAGGELGPERIELILSPELSSMSVESLLSLLNTLGTGSSVSVRATSRPWRFKVVGPELPHATIETYTTTPPFKDLLIRVVLGSRAGDLLLDRTVMRDALNFQAAEALRRWAAVNQTRPLVEHPAFKEIVVLPANGAPGIYLIRMPPLLYSPMIPVHLYRTRITWAVVESVDEVASCRAYYRTPGASFSTTPPFFRNQPPCSLVLAQLAGGIVPGSVLVLQTSWETSRTVVVYTLPDDVLQKSSGLRRKAYRGRYLVTQADNNEEAMRAIGMPDLALEDRPTRCAH